MGCAGSELAWGLLLTPITGVAVHTFMSVCTEPEGREAGGRVTECTGAGAGGGERDGTRTLNAQRSTFNAQVGMRGDGGAARGDAGRLEAITVSAKGAPGPCAPFWRDDSDADSDFDSDRPAARWRRRHNWS